MRECFHLGTWPLGRTCFSARCRQVLISGMNMWKCSAFWQRLSWLFDNLQPTNGLRIHPRAWRKWFALALPIVLPFWMPVPILWKAGCHRELRLRPCLCIWAQISIWKSIVKLIDREVTTKKGNIDGTELTFLASQTLARRHWVLFVDGSAKWLALCLWRIWLFQWGVLGPGECQQKKCSETWGQCIPCQPFLAWVLWWLWYQQCPTCLLGDSGSCICDWRLLLIWN